jgi:small redox-active disulfide protein 2
VKIEVLGTGCPKCRETLARVRSALDALGIRAEIHKVEDIRDIMTFGVIATPAVAIDGAVRISGRVPTVEELTEILGSAE